MYCTVLLTRTLQDYFSDTSEMGTLRNIAIFVFVAAIFCIALNDIFKNITHKKSGGNRNNHSHARSGNTNQQPNSPQVQEQMGGNISNNSDMNNMLDADITEADD